MAGKLKILIIGGGPAGLSLARLLGTSGRLNVTVAEKSDRIGGKSFSVGLASGVVEFGTCYATRAHRTALAWMKQTGIHVERVGDSHVDGVPLLRWVKQAGTEPLIVEGARYIDARSKLLTRLTRQIDDPALLRTLAAPTQDWLDELKLHKISRLMLRIVTGMGYGRLDEVPLLHTLRWVDPDLLLSGVFHDVFMPVEGWSEFWSRLAAGLNIRTNLDVTRIERSAKGARVDFANGETGSFDTVVCAVPLDTFLSLTEAKPDEIAIARAVAWGGFATTLAVVEGWPARKLEFFSEAATASASDGRLLSRRSEGREATMGGDLYILNQLPGQYTRAELGELLALDCARSGGRLQSIVQQQIWEYFPQLAPAAINAGVLRTMRDIQGQDRTWYTGATFSHEAISNIVVFNTQLARKIAKSA